MNEKNTILVICTGNTCRSPMAQGILQKLIDDNNIENTTVISMGLSAFDGDSASQNAVEALNEIDIDISGHRARSVMIDDINNADSIYVMTLQHKNVIVETVADSENKIIVMDIPDPFGQSYERYRNCRDLMIDFFNKELGIK